MYERLYTAWRRFKKGKRPSRAIDTFAYQLESELYVLAHDIDLRAYRHGGYQAVTVREKKRRDLAVADVRDRVVHRYVYDQLVALFDKGFDPDAWSCRVGKGLHAALARTQQLLGNYPEGYVWRADITKFFDNVGHERLLQALRRRVEPDSELFWLCEQIVASYTSEQGAGIGIPIGNLTSQIFANIYLSEFDHFVRHTLKPQACVRYGDDFVLFTPTRRLAHQLRRQAAAYLREELGLRLNHTNDVVVPAADGLHFLGHVVTARYVVVDRHTSGAVLRKVSPRNLASYQSLYLAQEVKRQLHWVIHDTIDEIDKNA